LPFPPPVLVYRKLVFIVKLFTDKLLADITKLTEIDVLIATHSPQIIHDRWDLTVELKGSKE
jgi:predicted ATP-binding protein involved in virulence